MDVSFSAKLSLGMFFVNGSGSLTGTTPGLTLGVFAHYFVAPFPMKWKLLGHQTVAGVPKILRHAVALNISIGIGD